MSDREQIRRDVEYARRNDPNYRRTEALARHCLALLAELEQADYETEAFRLALSIADERTASLTASAMETELCAAMERRLEEEITRRVKAEARLAKADALMEALEWIASADMHYPSHPTGFRGDWTPLRDRASEALAAWENT